MSESPNRKLQDQFMLRLPNGMRDRVRTLAEKNNRSMNSEIIAALEAWVGGQASTSNERSLLKSRLDDLAARRESAEAQMTEIRRAMHEVIERLARMEEQDRRNADRHHP